VRGSDRRHFEEAAPWFLKGCELGDADGCQEYGEAQAGLHNDHLAADGYARACKLGDRASCHFLAAILFGDPATSAEAAAVLEQNCARDFGASCTAGAVAFAPLLGPMADCKRAAPLAEKTCRFREAWACAVSDACKLATDSERAGAVARLRTACDRKVAIACLYWADAQTPSSAEPGQVRSAYETACRRGEPSERVACPRLAALQVAAATTEAEATRPLSLLIKGCAMSIGEACCALADLHKSARWLPPDPSRVADLQSKACALGQSRCCATPGRN
jgi:TPR repeat protein